MKKLRFILYVLLIFFIGLFIYSSYNIVCWYFNNKETNKQIEEVQKEVEIKEIETNEENEVILEQPNDYWDYTKMNLIDIDFKELKSKNKDTVGWIYIPNTNVNYPFVQYKNNEYYLKHSYNNSYNNAGWIFLDYRNNINNLGQNTLIYGHGRLDKTMFGSLRTLITNNWLNNKNNHIIKIVTEDYSYLFQIFSVYKIKPTSDYLETSFKTETSYQSFINLIKNRSIYNFNTTVNTNNKIITLSTCYDDNYRLVVHAKLIKYAKK